MLINMPHPPKNIEILTFLENIVVLLFSNKRAGIIFVGCEKREKR